MSLRSWIQLIITVWKGNVRSNVADSCDCNDESDCDQEVSRLSQKSDQRNLKRKTNLAAKSRKFIRKTY